MTTVKVDGGGGSMLARQALIREESLTLGTGTLDPRETEPARPASEDAAGPGRAGSVSLVDISCRTLDIVVAASALVLLSPVLLVIAIIIRLESPGPAVFRQRRLGRGVKPFTVNKFRTMRQGSSHEAHRKFVQSLIAGEAPPAVEGRPRFKMASDPRITRAGRFLRKTSLDELPQLWNVLWGDMSLVGPRPPISYEVERYPAGWFARFQVKPGLTGLWQVSGRCELTLDQMIELDLEYVRRRSLLLNVWILLRTVPAVLSLRGAS
jgi:lipopolysaccharide/colanic/teichoic acid biosynthesis glycosyltransferase